MLRTILLCGLICLSTAADVRHQSVAEYTQTGLKLLGDELKKISAPGDSRQIAINALMRNVEGSTKLTPDQIEILQNVTVLLDQILDTYRDASTLASNDLTAIIGIVANCHESLKVNDAQMEADVDNARSQHNTCRVDQKVLFDEDAHACGELITLLQGYINSPPQCEPPAVTHTVADEVMIVAWTSYLSAGTKWFEDNQPAFIRDKEACESSSTNLATKDAECDTLQRTLEAAQCLWYQMRHDRCTELDNCYTTASNNHNNHTATEENLAGIRLSEAKMIVYIKCLVKLLIDGGDLGNLNVTCPMPDATHADLAGIAITTTDIPGKENCDINEALPIPLSVANVQTAWDAALQNDLPAGLTHDVLGIAVHCPAATCWCHHGTPSNGSPEENQACINAIAVHNNAGLCKACDEGFYLQNGGCYPNTPP